MSGFARGLYRVVALAIGPKVSIDSRWKLYLFSCLYIDKHIYILKSFMTL